MPRALTSLAPTILGLIGGGLGLFTMLEFIPSAAMGCSCGFDIFSQAIIAGPIIGGSVVGLVGGFACLANRYLGGTLLLVGGALALAPLFLYFGVYMLLFPLLWVILGPSLFFGTLLELGGLLAFPETRHVLKVLHDGGWIP